MFVVFSDIFFFRGRGNRPTVKCIRTNRETEEKGRYNIKSGYRNINLLNNLPFSTFYNGRSLRRLNNGANILYVLHQSIRNFENIKYYRDSAGFQSWWIDPLSLYPTSQTFFSHL